MHLVKRFIIKTTGYWLHKINTLPVGSDLFVDIREKIKYSPLRTLFDVGANTGQTREWFRLCEPKAKIYCFEPVDSTFKKLIKNSRKDRNSVLENMALGKESGEKSIRLFEDNMAVLNSLKDDLMNNNFDAKEERIRIETLDHYCDFHCIPMIDLLKIDTEGYELDVLTGARKMMREGAIPFIYCETGFQQTNQRNTFFPALTDFLAAEDYYFFGLYQMDYHDWKSGNHLGNALYIHKSILW